MRDISHLSSSRCLQATSVGDKQRVQTTCIKGKAHLLPCCQKAHSSTSPMTKKILLTSFTTWLPHQKSNTSNDLFTELLKKSISFEKFYFLRKIPVDFELAPQQVVSKIEEIQPDCVICCGMAESRKTLTIESNGSCGNEVLRTAVNLNHLVRGLAITNISHDAGKFVCDRLYYSTLKYLYDHSLQTQCIFVHVPILTEENMDLVVADFLLIVQRMQSYEPEFPATPNN